MAVCSIVAKKCIVGVGTIGGRFISAIEVEGWSFDGGSGRRASILAGYAW